MKLSQLIDAVKPLQVQGPTEIEISGLAYDSRRVEPGQAFFALPGVRTDGRRFIGQALDKGARLVVGQAETEPLVAESGATYLQVADSRAALALAAQAFHGQPSRRLDLVGVTGTSGKTTITFALESILTAAGQKVGVIGTNNYRFPGQTRPAPVTTPQSLDLARLLEEMVGAGVETAVMEVSSHALDQGRVLGCRFKALCFSNLSRDHLDYHPDMEGYFQAKRRLFQPPLGGEIRAAVNLDDSYGRRLSQELDQRALTFGLDKEAQVTAKTLKLNGSGIKARILLPDGSFEVDSPLLGQFNLLNLLAAAALAWLLQIEPQTVAQGLNSLKVVPGRMEDVGRPFGRRVIVDYSHKVEALERALSVARDLTQGRIISVFGCGGDRDQGKRPLMGRTAALKSDLVILTSDNPRSEDPRTILSQIRAGVKEAGSAYFEPKAEALPQGRGFYTIVEDRSAAIRLAVAAAQAQDTVIICGKGHENYQIVGSQRRHLDDREEALKALQEL